MCCVITLTNGLGSQSRAGGRQEHHEEMVPPSSSLWTPRYTWLTPVACVPHSTRDSYGLCTPQYTWLLQSMYHGGLPFLGWGFHSLRTGRCKVSSSGLSQVFCFFSILLTVSASFLGTVLTNLVRSLIAMGSCVSHYSGDHYRWGPQGSPVVRNCQESSS